MANRASIAARAATASARITAAMGVLAEREGVDLPPSVGFPYRQPELRAAAEQERVADFLERMAGIEQAKPEEPAEPKAPADEPGDDEPEPTFHGKPLSDFDGMSDDDILAVDGIGEATLKKIKAARADRDAAE